MGCDIHALVEVNWRGKYDSDKDPQWVTVIDNIGFLVGRSYDTFGVLFGVRNYVKCEPLAEKRGIPEDRSDRLQERILEDQDWCHSFTYLTVEDVDEADWSLNTGLDNRITVFNQDGKALHKSSWSSEYDDLEEFQKKNLAEGKKVDHPNNSDYYLKRTSYTREDCLSEAWKTLLFTHMGELAKIFGNENVRLVAWFDN